MSIILFSSDIQLVDEWKSRFNITPIAVCFDSEALLEMLQKVPDAFILSDYDSIASELNKFVGANALPKNTLVLEKSPEIQTGKFLIMQGVKAYGNSRMHLNHFEQMYKTVEAKKVWTYPELTAALNTSKQHTLSSESKKLLDHRLTKKEVEVVELILKGLTNDAIATTLEITPRTVKAHVGSIFSKLHVNDRVGLILLLK